MRLLLISHAYYPSRGGVQWLIQSLAERLTREAGDSVTVFTTDALSCELFIDARQPRLPAGETVINGVRVRRFGVFNRLTWLRLNLARVGYKLRLPGQDWLRGLYFGPIVPGLRAAIRQEAADVIVAASFPMIHMYDALAAGQTSRRPVALIGTVHPTDTWSYDLRRMYRAISQAQAYLALSEYERDFLAPRCPGARIHVLGGGVDTAQFDDRQAGQAFRRRQSWREDELVIAMVGRMTAYKRPDVMLEAMPAIWRALPNARLVFAGAGTQYTSALQERIRSLSQADRVTLIADFDEQDKPAIYAAADIIAHLSDRESFGIVIVEAWAAGRPVIGARAGASASIISDGEDGLLVRYGDPGDLADAVIRLGRSPALRETLGTAGRKKAREQYDWRALTPRYRQIFGELAEMTL